MFSSANITVSPHAAFISACVSSCPYSACSSWLTIFGNGQMENIPIGIVDRDNTATSRSISRRISAAPAFRVAKHFTDEASARQALQQKEIYGYLSIPPRFEQKAVRRNGRNADYYYHYALLSVGSELMATFETIPRSNSPVPYHHTGTSAGGGTGTDANVPPSGRSRYAPTL